MWNIWQALAWCCFSTAGWFLLASPTPHLGSTSGNSPLPEKTVELHRGRATMFGLYQWRRVKTPKSENTSSRSGTQAGALWFSITQWRAIWEGRLLDTQLERRLGRKALGFLWFWAACLGLPVPDALKDPVTPSPLSEVSLFPVSIIFQEKKWNVTSLKMLPKKKKRDCTTELLSEWILVSRKVLLSTVVV